jgi:hypothetical protein
MMAGTTALATEPRSPAAPEWGVEQRGVRHQSRTRPRDLVSNAAVQAAHSHRKALLADCHLAWSTAPYRLPDPPVVSGYRLAKVC